MNYENVGGKIRKKMRSDKQIATKCNTQQLKGNWIAGWVRWAGG